MDWRAKNLSRFHVLILISVKVLRVLFPKYKSNIHGKGLKIKSLSSWIRGCHPDLQTPWSWWFNDISKFAGALEFFTLIIINNIAGPKMKDFSVKNQSISPILFLLDQGEASPVLQTYFTMSSEVIFVHNPKIRHEAPLVSFIHLSLLESRSSGTRHS